jgi:hypothetical protein
VVSSTRPPSPRGRPTSGAACGPRDPVEPCDL